MNIDKQLVEQKMMEMRKYALDTNLFSRIKKKNSMRSQVKNKSI